MRSIRYLMMRHIKSLSEPRSLLFLGSFYSALIMVLSLIPTTDFPKLKIPLSDKIVHLVFYMALSFIWLLYIFKKFGKLSHRNSLLVVLGCLIYGIVIEVLQEVLVSSRQADLLDILANFIGIILGWTMFLKLKFLFEVKNEY